MSVRHFLPHLILLAVFSLGTFGLHFAGVLAPETPAAPTRTETLSKVLYMGAVLNRHKVDVGGYTQTRVRCVYGDFYAEGLKDPDALGFSTGTRLTLIQTDKGLHPSTDLEKWSMQYNERDLKRIQQDLQHDLEVWAERRAEKNDASEDPRKILGPPVHPPQKRLRVL